METKLRQIIAFERTISANKDEQLATKDLIIGDWKDKFDLSEGRRKRARVKGRKEGAVVTAIFVAVLFVLGK